MKNNSDNPESGSLGYGQLTLFNRPSLNVIADLKASMRESIRRCELSRDQIVGKMTEITRAEGLRGPGNLRAISKAILDKWVSDSSIHIIPLTILPIFCAVVNSSTPLQTIAKPLELNVITRHEKKILLWAEAEIQRRKPTKKARKLAEEIEI